MLIPCTLCNVFRRIPLWSKQHIDTGVFQQIASEFHLLVAATKAMNGLVSNAMTTHGIHTELIYCLSGAKSISDALSTFGISDSR
jgi:tRNA threonylcarbamoyladenosine modification (KEOPS) complex Cgi121 subunit